MPAKRRPARNRRPPIPKPATDARASGLHSPERKQGALSEPVAGSGRAASLHDQMHDAIDAGAVDPDPRAPRTDHHELERSFKRLAQRDALNMIAGECRRYAADGNLPTRQWFAATAITIERAIADWQAGR